MDQFSALAKISCKQRFAYPSEAGEPRASGSNLCVEFGAEKRAQLDTIF